MISSYQAEISGLDNMKKAIYVRQYYRYDQRETSEILKMPYFEAKFITHTHTYFESVYKQKQLELLVLLS